MFCSQIFFCDKEFKHDQSNLIADIGFRLEATILGITDESIVKIKAAKDTIK